MVQEKMFRVMIQNCHKYKCTELNPFCMTFAKGFAVFN